MDPHGHHDTPLAAVASSATCPSGHFHEPPKGSRASPSLAATGCQLQRRGLCRLAAPHRHPSLLLSFLWACPVLNLNPLHLNSGDSAPTRNGRIHTLAEEQAIAFTHLPGAYLTSAKSLGRAALVLLCTGHMEKSVTDHARVHIWERSAFQSPQHPRSRASGPALKARCPS